MQIAKTMYRDITADRAAELELLRERLKLPLHIPAHKSEVLADKASHTTSMARYELDSFTQTKEKCVFEILSARFGPEMLLTDMKKRGHLDTLDTEWSAAAEKLLVEKDTEDRAAGCETKRNPVLRRSCRVESLANIASRMLAIRVARGILDDLRKQAALAQYTPHAGSFVPQSIGRAAAAVADRRERNLQSQAEQIKRDFGARFDPPSRVEVTDSTK